MKKLLLVFVLALAFNFTATAQNYDINLVEVKEEVKIDSILIFVKGKAGVVGKVYKKEDLLDELDFVSMKYRTNTFNVVKYFSNGRVIQCKVSKKVNGVVERKVDFNIHN
jgi:hypothetical protein